MDNFDDEDDDIDCMKNGKASNGSGDIGCDAFSNSRMSFGLFFNP